MTNSENRPFLTIKKVSKLIGLSVSTINRMIKKGDFPSKVKVSPGRMVFMKYQIKEWIDQKKVFPYWTRKVNKSHFLNFLGIKKNAIY